MITSRSFLLTMSNISDKLCRENQDFFPKIVPYMRWSRKNIVEPHTPQMTIWRMRIIRSITKATDTHSVYVILTDSSRQQWLREPASMVPHMHIASLVYNFSPSVSRLVTTDQQNHLGFSAAYRCSAYKLCISTAYTDAHGRIHNTYWSIHDNQYTDIYYILKMGRVMLVIVMPYKFYCKVSDSHSNIKIVPSRDVTQCSLTEEYYYFKWIC